ncbi:HpcH/HpaI aldolase/citrate lyase family protein [Mycolicibacterium neoaurum]|uniref:HpcH/HpaI aldolase/citrate lyase family protein n=1 Tax=Mycolicibacterium neoaurum TaxID=1795 RepID=UPI003AB97FB5
MTDLAERIGHARSALFVPGDRPARFAKALDSGADLVILDLEDAVAVEAKESARVAVSAFLDSSAEVVVRVNGTDTSWCADDLAALAQRRCAVMVPKAHSVDQLNRVSAVLPAGTALIPLIETGRGVAGAAALCGADSVVRAAFGSVDLGAELGVDPDSHTALQYARSAVVLASAVAGCAAPLDGVTTDLTEGDRLAADLEHAAILGFTGKMCIHPAQVHAVNRRFTPTDSELRWAERVVTAAAAGGACAVDGKMVDKPVVDRARGLLARAR